MNARKKATEEEINRKGNVEERKGERQIERARKEKKRKKGKRMTEKIKKAKRKKKKER